MAKQLDLNELFNCKGNVTPLMGDNLMKKSINFLTKISWDYKTNLEIPLFLV
jgi:hypothetical protein